MEKHSIISQLLAGNQETQAVDIRNIDFDTIYLQIFTQFLQELEQFPLPTSILVAKYFLVQWVQFKSQ